VSGLPRPLEEAIARYSQHAGGREIAGRAAKLSDTYRAGAPSAGTIASRADVAAYLTARLPATYAALAAALEQVRRRAADFAPKTVLDFGAGPGTASWAAIELWPGIESVTMLDTNSHFASTAAELVKFSDHPGLHNAQIHSSPLAGSHYDLILAGYVFSELSDNSIEQTTSRLWQLCSGVLVIVEPGTPRGFARMLRCREVLSAANARLAAPCPGNYPCPIVDDDWCHFAVRLPRSRDHMRAKGATLPFEDEKFSYVAAARETVSLGPSAPRILAQPHTGKAGIRLKLCADGKITETGVPRRDKPEYKRVGKKKWGDTVD
jgi:ribosomal protein RSM22 (predicted rRNA methylase)